MKLKFLVLIPIMMLTFAGVALAVPEFNKVPSISSPFIMFLLGLLLIGTSFLGKRLYAEQVIDRRS
jgi:hypothetical protein